MSRCPSELELESYLLAPARSRVAGHVETCSRCAAQLAEMRRLGDEFRREVFPLTVDAVVERSVRRPWAPRWLLVLAPAVAAAAVAGVLLVPRPPADYVGAKGGGLGFTVYVSDAGGTRAARDGEAVAARAPIRFQVKPAGACRLWVVSVDGTGAVSRLYPVAGEAVDVGASAETLPGGAVLDGRSGPERIFAVCAPVPLAWSDVARSAHAAAAGGDAAVRTASRLEGLPQGASQATVLLEKRP
jgi:hypothetical protein